MRDVQKAVFVRREYTVAEQRGPHRTSGPEHRVGAERGGLVVLGDHVDLDAFPLGGCDGVDRRCRMNRRAPLAQQTGSMVSHAIGEAREKLVGLLDQRQE